MGVGGGGVRPIAVASLGRLNSEEVRENSDMTQHVDGKRERRNGENMHMRGSKTHLQNFGPDQIYFCYFLVIFGNIPAVPRAQKKKTNALQVPPPR
jgi:hypothetical protein